MATPYKVGDLEVSIKAISNDALTSLDMVITKMSSLSSVLKSITTADMKWITSFGTRMKTLSKNMQSIDWGVVEGGFNNLTKAITPFLDKVKSAEASLRALNDTMTRVSGRKIAGFADGVGGIVGGRNTTSTSLRLFSRIVPTLYMARRLANVMGKIVQYGVDYTETLNLWQVAMRDNVSMATEFVNKMSKAYGISQKTLMQAQATFRNMIGSLGDLSDDTSYALSEAITQMAIDYSSLYNAPIEEAINKFQSALAGQVRPIRSISGYDITEKTIQALYEALGGTKTQRQLSRTEKQLLAIYAIFNQMEKSGALGDMAKTLENFANQSRMMVEGWKELATWVGTIITHLLQENGIMLKINAGLIYAGALVREMAYTIGYEMPNFAAGWENDVDNTSKAVDKLKGKLLGFDKIRALSTEQEDISIDEKLLNALSGYTSILDNVENKAQTLAETWKELTFWEDGVFQEEKAKEFFDNLKIGVTLFAGLMTAMKLTSGKVALLGTTLSKAFSLKNIGIGLLIASLIEAYQKSGEFKKTIQDMWSRLKGPLSGIFNTFTKIVSVGADLIAGIVKLLDNLGLLTPALYALIGLGLANRLLVLTKHFTSLTQLIGYLGTNGLLGVLVPLEKLLNSTTMMYTSFAVLGAGIATFISNFDKLSDRAKVWIPVLSALAGIIAALAIAKAGMSKQAIVTAGAIVTGVGLVVGTLSQVKQYKDGGVPDKGTLFYAGEAGAEIVSTTSSGQTGVSNVQQIEQAFYNALQRWSSDYLSSQFDATRRSNAKGVVGAGAVFESVVSEAKRRGLTFSKKG